MNIVEKRNAYLVIKAGGVITSFFGIVLITVFFIPSMLHASEQFKLITAIYGDEISGPFNQPSGIFFDEEKKRLCLADTMNNRLVSFDSTYVFISEFNAEATMKLPLYIVKDSKERLIVTESQKNQVTIINIKEKASHALDFSQVPQKNPIIPGSLAIDSKDNLYVIDRANKRILIFDNKENYVKELTIKEGLTGFDDVKVNEKGHIYAIDTLKGQIYVFANTGKLLTKFGKRGKGEGKFDFPVSLAVDRRGLIYVVDRHKNMVLIFTEKGEFQESFSQLGWQEEKLYYPSYIFIDKSQRIFVVDRDNDRIQIFKR